MAFVNTGKISGYGWCVCLFRFISKHIGCCFDKGRHRSLQDVGEQSLPCYTASYRTIRHCPAAVQWTAGCIKSRTSGNQWLQQLHGTRPRSAIPAHSCSRATAYTYGVNSLGLPWNPPQNVSWKSGLSTTWDSSSGNVIVSAAFGPRGAVVECRVINSICTEGHTWGI